MGLNYIAPVRPDARVGDMRKAIVFSGMMAMLGLASANAYAQDDYYGGGDNGYVVRCESIDSRTRECPADTRDGIRLARQLSKKRCIEGRNWGYHRRVIWVAGGCRADFEVGSRSGWRQSWLGRQWLGWQPYRALRIQ